MNSNEVAANDVGEYERGEYIKEDEDEREKYIKEDEEDRGEYIKEDERSEYLKEDCLLYTSPSPRDRTRSRMPSSA